MHQLRPRILMIEDDEKRLEILRSWLPEDLIVVQASSAGRALGILEKDRGYVYAGIMLDHDLQMQTATEADKALSGSDIVNAVIGNIDRRTAIFVHSYNRARAPLMAEKLRKAKFSVYQKFFDMLAEEEVRDWAEDALDYWRDWNELSG
ncbi:MAG: cyclic-phosphate processing receiver domain-containing protein [Bacteroidota bacterium]